MSAINVDNATTAATTTTTCSASPSIGPQNRRQEETCLLTDHDVNKVLERKFRGGGGFRLVDWRLEPLEAKGFLGRYYQLRVMASRADDKRENLRFFVKVPPPDGDVMLKYLRESDAFNKEIDVYTDLIRRMDRIGRSEWSVECYLCKRDVLIVLEDVSINGYAVVDKYVPLDEEHCVLLLKSLARLHSRSLILEERLRREGGRSFLDLYGDLLKEAFFIDGHDMTVATIAAGVKAIYAVIDLIRELDECEKISAKRRIGEWMLKVPRLLAPSSVRRNVVCHRDVWANNFMFRHDPAGKPRGCYLIDFQFFCYAPPAIDFAFCLYLSTDRATRESRFDAYARIYHDLFARNLAEEGFDVEEYLPWAEFQESYAEVRNTALAYACNALPVILLSSETTKDYFYNAADKVAEVMLGDGRMDLVLDQCRKMPAYKARIVEIILEAKDRLPEHPPSDL